MSSTFVDSTGTLIGTRITVYHLVVDFLDSKKTETEIARFYEITPEQVVAGRGFIFENIEQVLKRHLEIEDRNSSVNSAQLVAEGERIRDLYGSYRNWIDHRRKELESSRESKAGTNAN